MALVAMSGINRMGDNTPYIDQYGNLVDYTGGATVDTTASTTDWWSTILKSAPSIITALNPAPARSQYYPTSGGYVSTTAQPASTGISTNTVLLLGAAGLAAYFLLKKK
jgi:hypothetical protein